MFENLNVLVALAGLFVTVFAAVWSLAWWLSGQFTAIRNLVYTTAEKTAVSILSKLEYHEKHDDNRFNSIRSDIARVNNDIWDLRVRNAAADGLPILKVRKEPVEEA